MLIEIEVDKLRVGMYVHHIDVSWYNHPFWRRRFLLRSESDRDKLINSGARKVLIDDEKGIGVIECERAASPILAPNGQTSRSTLSSSKPRAQSPNRPVAENVFRESAPRRLTGRARREEMRRASNTLNQSKKAVMSMFGDARLGKAVNTKGVEKLVSQISKSVNKDASIILNIARLKSKDEYTFLHSVSVCALMINLARTLGLNEQTTKAMGVAGMLHDIGKMSIPAEILNKPARLNDQEMNVVRNHPERGYEILLQSGIEQPLALDVCLHHHEKIDGTGYPNRMSGDDISLASRMAAICDVYDAITSQRAYNSPFSASEALAQMVKWKGHFDQLLLKSFVESLGIWPVGAVVLLSNDMLAIVVGEDPQDYTKPLVRTFYSVERSAETTWRDIQISHAPHGPAIEAMADPSEFGIHNWDEMAAQLLAL